ncbi:MAG: 3-oxoacyl-ACP reductase FabG [Gammaproteobacteria bacterium]
MEKVAIVTGASRGIGAATAKLLAETGHAVCINYHNKQEVAEKLANEITQNGGKAITVRADLANETDIIHMFEQTDQLLGPVTVLVNNAGINGGAIPVENITAKSLQAVFATNVFGTFYCCREAVKRMKKNKYGSIVTITSEAARFGGTQITHYAASKAALNTMTIGFAREVAADNIRVNAVSPGVIDTDIHAGASPERITTLLNSIPMKRMGTTQEVAKLIVWLLSDAASYVSGAIIPITGSR